MNDETTRDRHSRYKGLGYASLALAYAPLLFLHFRWLSRNEHYHHFPLVLVAICVLAWTRSLPGTRAPWRRLTRGRWRRLDRADTDASGLSEDGPAGIGTPDRMRFWGSVFGLLLLASAVLLWSPWLALVSAIVMIGAVVFGSDVGPVASAIRSQGDARKRLTPVWLLLWLLVPLPFGWDRALTSQLQGLSSRAGSALLDWFGHDHLLAGHVIEVPGQQFLVEEACSGVRSVFVLVTCAALFAVVSRRRWFHAFPLIVIAVFVAVVTNVGRVFSVVLLNGEFGIDATQGWQHEALGAAFFAAAILLLMSADQVLKCLLAPLPGFMYEDDIHFDDDDEEQEEEEDDDEENPDPAAAEPASSSRRFARPLPGWIAVSCALLFVVQVPLLRPDGVYISDLSGGQQEPLADPGETSLPAEYEGWTRISYELVTRDRNSNYGAYSNTWTFQRQAAIAIVCLDYPFTGWHALEQCYRGQGWSVASRQVVTSDHTTDPLPQPFVQIELERPTGETALLLFSLFDREAQPLVAPPTEVSLTQSLRRLFGRLDSTFAKLGLSDLPNPLQMTTPTYQFQALVSKPGALTDEERRHAIDLFTHTRQLVLERWSGELGIEN